MAKRGRRNATSSDIQAIRESLVSIVESLVGALARVGEAPPPSAARRRPAVVGRRRRATLSAERRAQLELQGRYMGLLRSLRPRQKERVKALRAAKGVRSAIGLATRLTKG